jgi:hypothetical protein
MGVNGEMNQMLKRLRAMPKVEIHTHLLVRQMQKPFIKSLSVTG